ncbi:hypothetical protein G5V58_24275 [Nocardioides anomalus]|uniref:Uncharacterized protein n=1 Tax=Nocardioides anomalus TaxID=2712223 RepID=A0A6G6WJP2_9ACTN|nr:hypothetical protein [Nocardioides anomalus]QIG45449.1 hypothetical protein G5V58_24275 [Nocardioides anomalus]
MSSTTVTTRTTVALSTAQKVGLVLCALYSLSNIPSFLFPADSGDDPGPPLSILVVDTLLGVVGLVAAILAWRGNRVAHRIAAGAIIVITLTGLPAFFVDVPMAVKALVGFGVVLTVVIVVLMFSGPRRLPAAD